MNPIRGDSRESNSGPLAPEARIIPLDHYPDLTSMAPTPDYIGSASTGRALLNLDEPPFDAVVTLWLEAAVPQPLQGRANMKPSTQAPDGVACD